MKKLANQTSTSLGFPLVEFKDSYDEDCILEASTLAIYKQPGTSAIWLGIKETRAEVMCRDAEKLGIKTNQKVGWVDYPIPPQVLVKTRMHLERDKVKALINHLQTWLDSEAGQFVLTQQPEEQE